MATNYQFGIRLSVDGENEVVAATDKAGKGFSDMGARAEGLGVTVTDVVGKLKALAGAYVGVQTVQEFVRTADAATELQNKLKLATGSAEDASTAYGRLFTIAQQSRVSFVDLGDTFGAISRAGRDLGITQDRLLVVTQAIGNAMTISGGSASSMNAALVQLGQGLSSGTLRGEELNSVMEQTPRLARAIADGLGVTIGELREMGKQGQLTAEQVIGALERSAASLARELGSSTMTVGQAMTTLQNSAVRFSGEINSATGATEGLTGSISDLRRVIDGMSDAMEKSRESGMHWSVTLASGFNEVGKAALRNIPFVGAALDMYDAVTGAVKLLRGEKESLVKVESAEETARQAATIQGKERERVERSLKKSAEELAEMRGQLAGVDKNYLPLLQKLQDFRERGIVGEREYTDLVSKLADKNYKASESDKAREKALNDSAAAQKKHVEEMRRADEAYERLIDRTRDAIQKANEEAGATEKLTTAQKFVIDVSRQVNDGKIRLTDARIREIGQIVNEMDATDRLSDSKRREIDLAKQRNAEFDVAFDKMERERLATEDRIRSARTMLERIEDETAALGKSRIELALMAAEREAERDGIVRGTEAYDAFITTIRNAVIRRETTDASIAEMRRIEDDAKRSAEQIEQSLTDSIFRAFESGKGFWSTLWDGVVNTVKTTILKPIIQDTVKDFLGWFKAGAKTIDTTVLNPTFSTGGIAAWLDAFMGGLKSLLSWFSDAFSGVMSWLGTGIGSIVNGVGSLFGVSDAAGTIGSWLGIGKGASGGGGLLNTASNVSSLASLMNGGGIVGSVLGSSAAYGAALGTTSIGAGSQAAMLAAQTGQFGWAGLSATSAAASTASTAAAASSSTAAGAGAAAGMSGAAMAGLGAFGLFALGVLDVLNNDSTPRDWFGGAYRVDASGARTLGTAYNGELPGANGAMAAEAAQAINTLLAGLGSSQRLDFLQAAGTTGMGVYAGGKLTGGATFGEFTSNPNDPFYAPGGAYQYESNDPNSYIVGQDPWEIYDRASQFDTDPNSVAANFRLELGQAVIQALQAVSDLPASVADYLRGYDAESLSANQVAQIISQISVMQMQADARKSPSLDTSAEIKAMSQQIAYMSAKLIELGDHSKRTEENTRVTADSLLRAVNGAQPIHTTAGG